MPDLSRASIWPALSLRAHTPRPLKQPATRGIILAIGHLPGIKGKRRREVPLPLDDVW
jgi:hypothetical protein